MQFDLAALNHCLNGGMTHCGIGVQRRKIFKHNVRTHCCIDSEGVNAAGCINIKVVDRCTAVAFFLSAPGAVAGGRRPNTTLHQSTKCPLKVPQRLTKFVCGCNAGFRLRFLLGVCAGKGSCCHSARPMRWASAVNVDILASSIGDSAASAASRAASLAARRFDARRHG